MFDKLSRYGAMGQHMKFVTKNQAGAQYFRVGDTPSLLYLLDPRHNRDDPALVGLPSSRNVFTIQGPIIFTDDNGAVQWDYTNPCNAWDNLEAMYAHNKSTLENERSVGNNEIIK